MEAGTGDIQAISVCMLELQSPAMQTWVYKCTRKADTYLYVDRKDDFTRVPNALLDMIGKLVLVLEMDLSAREKLARADISEVREMLSERGFYLQLPPGESLSGGAKQ